MERLTIRNSDGSVSQPTGLRWAEALERLADYEDANLMPEEFKSYWTFFEDLIENQKASEALLAYRHLISAYKSGYVAMLQVKVGDTVWMWNGDFGTVLPYTVDLISVTNEGCGYSANCRHEGELLDSIDFEDEDMDKTIFHTQEEAGRALEAQDGFSPMQYSKRKDGGTDA